MDCKRSNMGRPFPPQGAFGVFISTHRKPTGTGGFPRVVREGIGNNSHRCAVYFWSDENFLKSVAVNSGNIPEALARFIIIIKLYLVKLFFSEERKTQKIKQ